VRKVLFNRAADLILDGVEEAFGLVAPKGRELSSDTCQLPKDKI
jgi:hypothetical protein